VPEMLNRDSEKYCITILSIDTNGTVSKSLINYLWSCENLK